MWECLGYFCDVCGGLCWMLYCGSQFHVYTAVAQCDCGVFYHVGENLE